MLGDRNQSVVQQAQGFEMRSVLAFWEPLPRKLYSQRDRHFIYTGTRATGLDITPKLPLGIKEKSPPNRQVPLPPSIPPPSPDYHSQCAVDYQQACQ